MSDNFLKLNQEKTEVLIICFIAMYISINLIFINIISSKLNLRFIHVERNILKVIQYYSFNFLVINYNGLKIRAIGVWV